MTTPTRILQLSPGHGPPEVRRSVALLLTALVERLTNAGAVVVGTERVGPEHHPDHAAIHLGAGSAQAVAAVVGTHVVVAPSPARGRRTRRRWSVGVSVHPWSTHAAPLNPAHVEVTACRAGGPGGQHVNTTSSAVHARHRPSGLTVRVSDQRSQARNRAVAMTRLAERLATLQNAAAVEQQVARWRAHHKVREPPLCEWVVGRRGALVERRAGMPVRVLPD